MLAKVFGCYGIKVFGFWLNQLTQTRKHYLFASPNSGVVEHAYLKEVGRADYEVATDEEALEAFQLLSKCEGIIPALESSHAIAHVQKLAPRMSTDEIILVSLSGRGDKDVDEVRSILAARQTSPESHHKSDQQVRSR